MLLQFDHQLVDARQSQRFRQRQKAGLDQIPFAGIQHDGGPPRHKMPNKVQTRSIHRPWHRDRPVFASMAHDRWASRPGRSGRRPMRRRIASPETIERQDFVGQSRLRHLPGHSPHDAGRFVLDEHVAAGQDDPSHILAGRLFPCRSVQPPGSRHRRRPRRIETAHPRRVDRSFPEAPR